MILTETSQRYIFSDSYKNIRREKIFHVEKNIMQKMFFLAKNHFLKYFCLNILDLYAYFFQSNFVSKSHVVFKFKWTFYWFNFIFLF